MRQQEGVLYEFLGFVAVPAERHGDPEEPGRKAFGDLVERDRPARSAHFLIVGAACSATSTVAVCGTLCHGLYPPGSENADLMKRAGVMWVMTAALAVGCGGGDDAAAGPETTAGEEAVDRVSVGTVTFSVDDVRKQYDDLPEDRNFYTPLASTVSAMPSEATGEQLIITFLSVDLKQPTYPASLPTPRNSGQDVDPTAAMTVVGFSYTDVTGREWAGSGRVDIQSFSTDGVLAGRFTDITLPHTDKVAPDITLTDGRFSARISAPW